MTFCRSMLLAWTCLLITPDLQAAESGQNGFATSDNFTVLAPKRPTREEADAYAEEVLAAAERLRNEIAVEWLGHKLPQRQGRTIVTVSFEPHRDSGLTWAITDSHRKYHNLYLSTATADQALGSTLAHEMVHIVFSTAFPHPDSLPIFLEEGIACRFDDAGRKRQRERQLSTYVQTQRWPRVAGILTATTIRSSDLDAYAIATSVTELLLSISDDRQRLLAFGQLGKANGWDAALKQYYDIANVHQLQAIWQRWVEQ